MRLKKCRVVFISALGMRGLIPDSWEKSIWYNSTSKLLQYVLKNQARIEESSAGCSDNNKDKSYNTYISFYLILKLWHREFLPANVCPWQQKLLYKLDNKSHGNHHGLMFLTHHMANATFDLFIIKCKGFLTFSDYRESSLDIVM